MFVTRQHCKRKRSSLTGVIRCDTFPVYSRHDTNRWCDTVDMTPQACVLHTTALTWRFYWWHRTGNCFSAFWLVSATKWVQTGNSCHVYFSAVDSQQTLRLLRPYHGITFYLLRLGHYTLLYCLLMRNIDVASWRQLINDARSAVASDEWQTDRQTEWSDIQTQTIPSTCHSLIHSPFHHSASASCGSPCYRCRHQPTAGTGGAVTWQGKDKSEREVNDLTQKVNKFSLSRWRRVSGGV